MLVKNEKYRAFLRGEMMQTILREDFAGYLDNVKHAQLKQARSMLVLLWATCKRPNEILQVRGGDVTRKGKYLQVKIPGSKGGFATPVLLPLRDTLVQEIWAYSKDKFPEQYLFWAFRSKSVKNGTVKTYRKKQADGTYAVVRKTYDRQYPALANNLLYWVNKWFGIPPYYFRHNRLTVAAGKLEANELRIMKGAKTFESVQPYLHYNEKMGKRIANELVK